MGVWELAWFVGVYVALLVCIFACVRIGYSIGWLHGFFNFVMLVLFAVCHWLLESWANVVAPFYEYPQTIFPDMVHHFQFGASMPDDPCARMQSPKVSATIPISGAVITFCFMWTARLLLSTALFKQPYRPAIVPLIAALCALGLDLFLDPTLSVSNSCPNGAPSETIHPGLGYWVWYTRASFADYWFSIPLFNYANWYAFPATMAAIVVLLGWARNAIVTSNPTIVEGFLYLILVIAFGLITITAPDAEPPIQQFYFILAVIAFSLGFIYRDWSTYKRNNPFRWEFVLPLLFYLLYPVLALFFSSAFALTTAIVLIIVALFLTLLGIWFITRPYFT